MRRSWLLAIAILTTCSAATSQERVFSCEHYNLRDEKFDFSAITNKQNDFFIVSVMTDRSVKRYYSRNGHTSPLLEQHISAVTPDSKFRYHGMVDSRLLRNYSRLRFAGGIYLDKKIIELKRKRQGPEIYLIETDLETGSITITDSLNASSKEEIIECFEIDKKFHFVTFQNITNKVRIYRKDGDSLHFKELRIEYNDESGKKRPLVLKRKDFNVYGNNQRYPLTSGGKSEKAFVYDDQLIITYPGENGIGYVAILDVAAGTYHAKRFSPNENEISQEKYNALYVVDSLLVSASAGKKQIRIRIFHLASGKQLYSTSVHENNIDSLNASPIQRTGSFGNAGEISASDFSEFYLTIMKDELTVVAYRENDNIHLSLGAVYKLVTGRDVLNVLGLAGQSYLYNTTGDYYQYYMPGSDKAAVRSHTSFDLALSGTEFNPRKRAANFSVWDQMATFIKNRNFSATQYVHFYMNGFYYIGYFDAKAYKFYVHRFDEKGIE